MKKVYEYSHLGGSEIMLVRHPEIDAEIDAVIAEIANVEKTKVSEEKTKPGMLLYDPKLLNRLFKQGFRERGFCELRDRYTIEIPACEASTLSDVNLWYMLLLSSTYLHPTSQPRS